MNWATVSFDWNHVRAFLATVDEGSLSAAARALGQTQPTLSRQIAELEQTLEVVLFERVGRRLVPTPTARDLIEHVRAMGAAASRISLAASGHSQSIEGRVRITGSDVFAAYVLPPVVAELQQRAPKVEIEIVSDNAIQDLQSREADIAIRHIRPTEPELIARALPDEVAHFYAATRYLDQRGRPSSIADLATHDIVSPGNASQFLDYIADLGVEIDPATCRRLTTDDGVVAWNLVRLGLAMTPMADRVAAATPGVERVLANEIQIRFPVWLITHRELHTSPRIRLIFDLLAECLSTQTSDQLKPLIAG